MPGEWFQRRVPSHGRVSYSHDATVDHRGPSAGQALATPAEVATAGEKA